MAAVFSRLPVKVLWRLLPSEIPDAAALAQLGLGNNTKVEEASHSIRDLQEAENGRNVCPPAIA